MIVNTAPIRAAARALGPIVVDRVALPRQWLPRAHHREVDLGRWRGTPIPVAPKTVRRLLGFWNGRAPTLLEDEQVFSVSEEHSLGPRRYWLFDPAMDAAAYYDAWAATRPMPRSHEELRIWDRVRRMLAIHDGHPFPENLLEGVFQKLLEFNNFSRDEVRGLMSLTAGELSTVLGWLERRVGEFCRRHPQVDDGVPISLAMFRQSLPAPIANAPRTCFARHRGHDFEPPTPNDIRRAWNLSELRDVGSLYTLLASASTRRIENVSVHIRVVARVEEIMRAFAPGQKWTAATYVAALRAYAIDLDILPDDLPDVRYFTVRMWRYIVGRLHIVAKQIDPNRKLGLRDTLPPRIKLPVEFREELVDHYGGWVARGQSRRKGESHALLAELDEVLDCARERRDLMRVMGNAFRDEVDRMLPQDPWRLVPMDVPVLDDKGRSVGRSVTLDFKVWRRADAWRSLGADGTMRDVAARRTGKVLDAMEGGFVAEYLPPPGEPLLRDELPWMLKLSIAGVLNCPRYLSWSDRALRHRLIVDGRLPGWKVSAAGLLQYDRDGQSLMRKARTVGRHFFPLEEAEHAMRLAYHHLDCVAQTMRRNHEVRQQVLDPWKEEKPEHGGEIRHVQMVRGKIPGRHDVAKVDRLPLRITETALNEAIDLCELHTRRCGYDEMPSMRPPDGIGWKVSPGQFVISFNGLPLPRSALGTFGRYLLAGWPRYTPHHFRHALSEEAALDGASNRTIADALGDNEYNAAYYSQLPHWAETEVQREDDAGRTGRQDARRTRKADARDQEGASR